MMEVPSATYRIQFSPEFGFPDAAGIVDYLADLGISHLYASPIFKARRGSAHGYDGVDPNRLNPQLGTPAEFEMLIRALQQHAMGWLQDIVPNHLTFDPGNRMLMDVLENGAHSKYHRFFDIEWEPHDQALRGRLTAPFLGRRLAHCLQDKELRLSFDASGFAVNYHHLKLPLHLASYAELLQPLQADMGRRLGVDHPACADLDRILERLDHLRRPASDARRGDSAAWIKRTLKDLYDGRPVFRQCLERLLEAYNGDREDGRRIADFGRLLCRQVFRLCHWKVAGQEINYRRFFDINELIALRQESRAVFDATHRLIKKLVDDGFVGGVRIDHIDGLADPAGYLQRLRDLLPEAYILVEKILEPAESLPARWPIQGSTGYDFTHRLNALFCDAAHEEQFNELYAAFSGQTEDFDQIVYRCKRQVLKNQLGGDLDNLAARIKQAAGQTPWGGDMTRRRLTQGLAEILARFPVYRTYIDRRGSAESDRRCIQTAVAAARRRRPQLSPELVFIRQMLLEKDRGPACRRDPGTGADIEEIITKFQQLAAPLTAKGFEDTALYIYNRLVSLNEVGGDPHCFGGRADDFHEFIQARAGSWPHSMNSTATHDSKRGEDVRARINVLSELPEEWERHLKSWHGSNRRHKIRLNGANAPDRNEEYLLYQTLLGTFPPDGEPGGEFVERISGYLVKALREAKTHTSWTEVNTAYEAAAVSFVRNILHPAAGRAFRQAFVPFCRKVAAYGIWNTLSQTLLKISAPGVPDFYQGTELYDFQLVDPDNRRPVDFAERKRRLAQILRQYASDPLDLISQLLADRSNGDIKLFLTACALRTRRAHPALFQNGAYTPLAAAGRHRAHVVACARTVPENCAVTVVPRFLTGLVRENQLPLGRRVWHDTEIRLPPNTAGRWKDMFTGEAFSADGSLFIGDILKHFPCALLLSC